MYIYIYFFIENNWKVERFTEWMPMYQLPSFNNFQLMAKLCSPLSTPPPYFFSLHPDYFIYLFSSRLFYFTLIFIQFILKPIPGVIRNSIHYSYVNILQFCLVHRTHLKINLQFLYILKILYIILKTENI